MAFAKTRTSIFDGQVLTAGAAATTSSVIDMSTYRAAALNVKLTNGATGPTVAAQVQIEVSADNSTWYKFGGPIAGQTGNNAVHSLGGIEIPVAVKYLRLVAGSNTGQNVTIDADITGVTE